MKSGMISGENQSLSARAVARHIRMSPRKVRLVLDAIRRKPVGEAFSVLTHVKKKAARIVAKILKSAVANAKVKKMDENRLFIRLAFADGGSTLKRYLPRAMGRADTILKRSSHITLVLEEGAVRNESLPKGGEEKSSKLGKIMKGIGKKKEKEARAGAAAS